MAYANLLHRHDGVDCCSVQPLLADQTAVLPQPVQSTSWLVLDRPASLVALSGLCQHKRQPQQAFRTSQQLFSAPFQQRLRRGPGL